MEPQTPIPGPRARAALMPEWLTDELLLGDGERKLTAWSAEASPPWPAPSAAEVVKRLAFIGDASLACIVAGVLAARIPRPVVDYVTTRVQFIGTGLRILGFCGPARGEDDRPWRVVVSFQPQHFEDLVAHEIAHCWTLTEPSRESIAAGAIYQNAMLAADWSLVPASLAASVHAARCENDQREALAARLAGSWGFHA
jgi:hypothetical protein